MPTNWSHHFSDRTSLMKGSAIRELLKIVANPEVISFAGGIPASEALPVQEVTEAFERVIEQRGRVALQYGETEGYRPLREEVAAMFRKRGVPANAENVILTTGSQQGLDLISKTLIDPGDVILVEMPTYVGALQAWRTMQPHFVGVPTDDDGMVIDAIETTPDADKASLAYMLPNFQNPSGRTMNLKRRQQALESAARHDYIIIEDDPYRALRYSGEDLPGLIELEAERLGSKWNEEGRVIHLGTFSKTLAPGLRIGWTLAPTPVIQMFGLAKQGTDLHSSMLSMLIAEDLVRENVVEKNVPKLQALYRERRDAMLESLDKEVGSRATWTRPDGGLFLWMQIPGETDSPGLLAEALKHNVAFVPGDAFFVDGVQGRDCLRLNFSMVAPDRIREGIKRLGGLLAERQAVLAR